MTQMAAKAAGSEPRVFKFGATELADPDPGLPTDQVKSIYAGMYPDLTNATITGPTLKDGKQVYEFKRSVGTKG